jgi:hypothetical protein
MNPMICSSVNLLFLMSVILQVDGLRCHYAGTAGRGQVTCSGSLSITAVDKSHLADLSSTYTNKSSLKTLAYQPSSRIGTRTA